MSYEEKGGWLSQDKRWGRRKRTWKEAEGMKSRARSSQLKAEVVRGKPRKGAPAMPGQGEGWAHGVWEWETGCLWWLPVDGRHLLHSAELSKRDTLEGDGPEDVTTVKEKGFCAHFCQLCLIHPLLIDTRNKHSIWGNLVHTTVVLRGGLEVGFVFLFSFLFSFFLPFPVLLDNKKRRGFEKDWVATHTQS